MQDVSELLMKNNPARKKRRTASGARGASRRKMKSGCPIRSKSGAADDAFRQSEIRYRDLVEKINDVIFEVDRRGVITYISPVVRKVLGYSANELIGTPYAALLYPEDRGKIGKAFRDVISGKLYPSDFRVFHKTGSIRWVRTSSQPIFHAGKRIGLRGVLTDITDRKLTEHMLQESEKRFRSLVEHSVQGLAIAQGDPPRLVMVSEPFARMLGYTVNELMSLDDAGLRNLLHPDDREWFYASYRRRIASNRVPATSEARFVRKDGKVLWFEILATSTEYKGKPAAQAAYVDITHRKLADEALRTSEARYRTLVEKQDEAVCRWLPDTTLTFVNEAYCRFFGKNREQLIGTKWLLLVPEDTREATRKQYAAMVRRSRRFVTEHTVISSGGRMSWQEWVDTPIRDDSGKLIELQSVGRDITERKLSEKRLRESEIFWRSLVENSPVSLARVGLDGKFVFVNRQFRRWSGLGLKQVIGKGPDILVQFLSPDTFQCMVKAVQETVAKRTKQECELLYRLKNGSALWIAQISYPWFDADGKMLGVEVVGHDVTQRKIAEAGREMHRAELEASEKELRQFAAKIMLVREEEKKKLSAVLHHEAGSLIVGMNAQFKAIKEATRNGQIQEALKIIDETREMLQGVVKGLKNLAVEIRPPDLDLLGLSEALRGHIARLASRHGLNVSFESRLDDMPIPPDVSLVMFRVAQEALHNVLLHAGAQNVRVTLDSDSAQVRLVVTDDGSGFDSKGSSATSGVHIGLRAMREMVTARGGTFGLKTEPGNGCEVSAQCPIGSSLP